MTDLDIILLLADAVEECRAKETTSGCELNVVIELNGPAIRGTYWKDYGHEYASLYIISWPELRAAKINPLIPAIDKVVEELHSRAGRNAP